MYKSIKDYLFKDENSTISVSKDVADQRGHMLYGLQGGLLFGFHQAQFELTLVRDNTLQVDILMDKPISEVERYVLCYRLNALYGDLVDVIRVVQHNGSSKPDDVWIKQRKEDESGLREGFDPDKLDMSLDHVQRRPTVRNGRVEYEGRIIREIGQIAYFYTEKGIEPVEHETDAQKEAREHAERMEKLKNTDQFLRDSVFAAINDFLRDNNRDPIEFDTEKSKAVLIGDRTTAAIKIPDEATLNEAEEIVNDNPTLRSGILQTLNENSDRIPKYEDKITDLLLIS